MEELASFISKYGIPKVIYVRGDKALSLMKEFSEKTGIKVEQKGHLRFVDLAYEELLYNNK